VIFGRCTNVLKNTRFNLQEATEVDQKRMFRSQTAAVLRHVWHSGAQPPTLLCASQGLARAATLDLNRVTGRRTPARASGRFNPD